MSERPAKSILLIIGGGIAAYKSLELVRLLAKRGIGVTAILTKAGAEFVTPLSLASLSGNKVYTELFSLTDEVEMGHIELSRAAGLVVVAPATADLMAKAALGLANDLASTALLATDKPVLMAPAMNVRMWLHPATQRNLAQLRAGGVRIVGPDEGEMACGEYGPGRMAEPERIAGEIAAMLAPAARPLAGCRVLVTAGPTHEAIDPVRYIANRSSGKQGYAIAAAAQRLGAETVLVSGPTHLPDPPGVRVVRLQTAREMLRAVEAALPADIAIFTAAVADWRVAEEAGDKIKKAAGGVPRLELIENPDILKTIAERGAGRPKLVVGFAAETSEMLANAREKLKRKGCDLIVANNVGDGGGVMGGDDNTVHLLSSDGVENWPALPKTAVAVRLMDRLAALLAGRRT